MTRLSLVLLAAVCVARAQAGVDLDQAHSELKALIERYSVDRAALGRRYGVPMSPLRRLRMVAFFTEWRGLLEALPFDRMTVDGRIDWTLFHNRLTAELRRLEHEQKKDAEVAALLPFWKTIVELAESRRGMEKIEGDKTAREIDGLREQVGAAAAALKKAKPERVLANRAVGRLAELRRTLRGWFGYYDGYDPAFSWWVKKPFEEAVVALDKYAVALGRAAKGSGDATLIGDPIGRSALLDELAYEMIPYSPEELIAIAKKEFAWCDAEMDKAAKAMGFDDWRKAQQKVKSLHVEPGKQPELIRKLAHEAIEFIEARDLVTVPSLCKEIWRMEMMSPQRQRTSPYFLGGETIWVAFPTGSMSHRDKLMSLRGNNRHFVRAVVHHELIPGHHLQGFMTQRHRRYRGIFRTPFWVEGWALYWEMRLWDLGFAKTSPEDRIGMLFWRKHRCARIIFSLGFHLKQMTARQCVDFLVERVGHERNNAEAEVRRSVGGSYGPLYQAAYMLGGLQVRALHKELVASGKLTERKFHDTILKQNAIPIELVRAHLMQRKLPRGFKSSWRFYGDR